MIGIEFRYFDGEDWATEWDSDEAGGFPVAVEVTILVDNERAVSGDLNYRMQADPETGTPYRTVVNLPVAEILEEEEASNSGGGG